MTSGNAGGEPICLGNREARTRLGDIANMFLFHNRDILVRVDDFVMFAGNGKGRDGAPPATPVRRAHGFVPEPLSLAPADNAATSVFAAGADLEHTSASHGAARLFVSQHIGDLAGCLDFFEETLRHLLALLEVEPRLVVRDPHPDYVSGRLAEAFARERGLPVFPCNTILRISTPCWPSTDIRGRRWVWPWTVRGWAKTVNMGGEMLFACIPRADAQRRVGHLEAVPAARRRGRHSRTVAYGRSVVAPGGTSGKRAPALEHEKADRAALPSG